MSSPNIEIHEFSTGVHFQQRNNGWVSLGFTGQYMNATINPIPTVVERSIANQEFALTEGSSTEKPAIIGRVVGSGDDIWSVMAVVTRGQDEVGRSAAFYRYFLSQGGNNLRFILTWWESEQKPRFNPLDTHGSPHLFAGEPPQPQVDETLPFNQLEPIVLPLENQHDLYTLNTLAIRKFNQSKNGLPVAWAFNVEALEKPERFQVIQPASKRAYDGLKRAIANAAQVVSAINVDEAALKSAIRSLMNSSTIKPEAVQEIVKGLENKEIKSDYWESLFNAQGADKALKQKIYSPQMVRLMTLRAMVIPETLPQFLEWLNIQAGKKPDESQTVSLDFQSKISGYLKEQIIYGIEFLLIELLQEQIIPERVAWLLNAKGSAWASCHKEFVSALKNDLTIIAKVGSLPKSQHKEYFNLLKFDNKIWDRLINGWLNVNRGGNLTDYYPLAKLFESTGDYKLAAYFYQLSCASVPKDVFSKLPSDVALNKFKGQYLGLNLKSKKNTFDKIEEFANDNFIPIAIGIILSFTAGILSLVWISFITKNHITDNKNIPLKSQPNPNKDEQIKEIEKHIGIKPENFQKTIAAILDISSSNTSSTAETSFNKIMQKIGINDNSITYKDFKNGNIRTDTNNTKKVAKAILEFQIKIQKRDHKIKRTAYLDKGDENTGFEKLKNEVKKQQR